MTISGQNNKASLRACSRISFPRRWVESHISHCSRVLRRCHPERSSCSGEFGCRSFKKHSPCTVCFLPCHVKKLACFYELKFFLIFCFLFGWSSLNISPQDSVLETKKLQAKVLNSTCRTILVCKLSQIVNFDGFWTLMVWHFWQLLSCTANQIIWTTLTGILINLL